MNKNGTAGELRERLLRLIREKALVFGERKLASGRTSSYYIDGKMITFDPEGLYLAGRIICGMIRDQGVDAVGGLAMGAVPIVAAVAVVSYSEGRPVKAFAVRSEKKDHGTEKRLEGHLEKGWRVAIVDDVITTGGSSFRAIEAAEEKGARVEKVIAIVDRLEGAREAFSRRNYQFESIFTRKDLGL